MGGGRKKKKLGKIRSSCVFKYSERVHVCMRARERERDRVPERVIKLPHPLDSVFQLCSQQENKTLLKPSVLQSRERVVDEEYQYYREGGGGEGRGRDTVLAWWTAPSGCSSSLRFVVDDLNASPSCACVARPVPLRSLLHLCSLHHSCTLREISESAKSFIQSFIHLQVSTSQRLSQERSVQARNTAWNGKSSLHAHAHFIYKCLINVC